jgi:hypothetical protein
MLRRSASAVLLVLGLAACQPSAVNLTSQYAHDVSDGKVHLQWNCLSREPGLVMQGVANNPYLGVPIKNLEFWVYGIDAQGHNVSNAHGLGRYLINLGDIAPFELSVQTTGTEVRFDLTYAYTMGTGPLLYSDARQLNTKADACPGTKR